MNKLLILGAVLVVLGGGAYAVSKPSTTVAPTGLETGIISTTTAESASLNNSTTNTTVTTVPSTKGTVTGQVFIGPTCPVQKIPADPACADKPYQTTISILQGGSEVAAVHSNTNGDFTVLLNSGTYTFTPKGGLTKFESCESKQVTVSEGKAISVSFTCDSGMR